MTGPQSWNRRAWLPLVLGWLLLFALAGVRPLMVPDEGRYVGAAWDMLQRGDWLVPTLNGLPFFHKPPLFYWITEAGLAVFGRHGWSARLAPVLGAGLAMSALFVLSVRWQRAPHAPALLVVLLAQPLFLLGGQYANLDMLVAGCITATLALLADAVLCLEAGHPWRRQQLAGYAMAGVGVLAKGLIGVVLPAMVLVVWLLASRRPRLVWRLISVPGLVLMLAVAVPWFVAVQLRYDGFFNYFFVVQHVQRFAASGFNNAQPVWFYGALLLLCFVPWAVWGWWSARRTDRTEAGQWLHRLMMCWAVGIVAFFSIPESKIVGYVLPAVPPLAWWLADGWRDTVRARRAWGAVAALGLLVSLGVVGSLWSRGTHANEALGRALGQARQPGEPVVMLREFAYDVPWLAGLREPVWVADDWHDPAIATHDNWRKELAEAGQFEPEQAARYLIASQAVPAVLCRATRGWVVGGVDEGQAEPWLAPAAVVASHGGLTLWRVDGDALRALCRQTPSGDRPGT